MHFNNGASIFPEDIDLHLGDSPVTYCIYDNVNQGFVVLNIKSYDTEGGCKTALTSFIKRWCTHHMWSLQQPGRNVSSISQDEMKAFIKEVNESGRFEVKQLRVVDDDSI